MGPGVLRPALRVKHLCRRTLVRRFKREQCPREAMSRPMVVARDIAAGAPFPWL